MAMHTRTHGANARSQSWEDYSDDRQSRRGNWLPLDALDAFDDEEVYESTPQLQALPATRRQVFRPAHPEEEVAPTSPQPRVAPRPAREEHRQPHEYAERGRQSGLPARTVAMAGAVAISLLGVF